MMLRSTCSYSRRAAHFGIVRTVSDVTFRDVIVPYVSERKYVKKVPNLSNERCKHSA